MPKTAKTAEEMAAEVRAAIAQMEKLLAALTGEEVSGEKSARNGNRIGRKRGRGRAGKGRGTGNRRAVAPAEGK